MLELRHAMFPFFSLDDPTGHTAEQTGLVERCIHGGINKLRMFLGLPMPVDRLPSEVLAQIFEYLPRPNQKADLIQVTHVCKRWRAVATGNAMLWTSFQVHNFDGVQELLHRSGSLPLSLYHTKGRVDPRVSRILAGVACRIRLLHVTMPEMDDMENLLAEFTTAAPLLQVLHLEHLSQNMVAYGRSLRVVTSLFNCEVPALHSLVVRGISRFPLTLPRTLRHFDLGGCDQDPLLYMHSLFNMLQACTNLETLTIRGRPPSTFSMEHHTRSVVLPKLSFLRLVLRPADVTGRVLMAFVLPANVCVSLATELDPDGDLVFDDILSRTCYPLPLPFEDRRWARSSVPVRRLHLTWNAARLLLRAYRDPGSEDSASCATGMPAIEIDCKWRPRNWLTARWEAFAYGWRFDVSRVETLVLEREPGERRIVELPSWSAALNCLPELKTLCMIRLHALDVMLLMRRMGGTPAWMPKHPEPCPCPKLSTLELREVEEMDRHVLFSIQTGFDEHFLEHADEYDAESWKMTLKMINCRGIGLESDLGLWGQENETSYLRIWVKSRPCPLWGCIVS